MVFNFLQTTNYKLQTRGGFSLLEAVVYIGILAVLFVAVVHTTILSTSAFGKSRVKRALAAEGATAVLRILHEVRLAESADAGASALGAHPGILSLVTRESAEDDTPTVRTFDVTDGTVRLTESGEDPAPLTESISVTNLVFHDAGARAVRVEMTAEKSYKSLTDTRTFYGTAVLRGGY